MKKSKYNKNYTKLYLKIFIFYVIASGAWQSIF